MTRVRIRYAGTETCTEDGCDRETVPGKFSTRGKRCLKNLNREVVDDE